MGAACRKTAAPAASNDRQIEGFSAGSRTQRRHHPDGWTVAREDTSGPREVMPPRGTVGFGFHTRPKKEKEER